MKVRGPKVNFIHSKYYDPIERDKAVCGVLFQRLKPGASDDDKRELEEFVNPGLKNGVGSSAAKLGIEDPYWTWDGRLVEKSSLPDDYPYNKGWRGMWDEYYKQNGWK